MKTLRSQRLALLGCLLVANTGCATLISGTHQNLNVDVRPPGSDVTLYRWNGDIAEGPIPSPSTTRIHRPKGGFPYLAVASKPGTCPRYWIPTVGTSPGGWVSTVALMATLGLAAICGALVDSIDGAMFQLDSSEFTNVMLQEEPCGS